MIRSREEDEETFIYIRELDGEIAGMAILVIEEEGEVVVINIVGRMDLAQLEKLGEAFDLPQLRPQLLPQLGDRPDEPAEEPTQPKPLPPSGGPTQEPAPDDHPP